jgi:hypothetical protein
MTKTELIQMLADATSSDRKSAKMFLEGLTGSSRRRSRRAARFR